MLQVQFVNQVHRSSTHVINELYSPLPLIEIVKVVFPCCASIAKGNSSPLYRQDEQKGGLLPSNKDSSRLQKDSEIELRHEGFNSRSTKTGPR